ncbi:response regulator [Leptolyngbya sp. FACHB-36]|nr:response regulator [Leptolyngbya sp. FACHB-36]
MCFKGSRILVVDDLADNLFLVQAILEAEGYCVETAESGTQALEKVKLAPPDLILLDVMMPGVNGYEVTRRIRQNRQIPFIPILLLTAHNHVSAAEGLNVGANDFIYKPINLDELLARVKAFLRLKRDLSTQR